MSVGKVMLRLFPIANGMTANGSRTPDRPRQEKRAAQACSLRAMN